VPLIVLVPLALVVLAVAVTAWLTLRVTRALALLQADLVVLHRLGTARELLVADLDRTRSAFGRTGADVWPDGRRR
jgi:hypothetical protein